MADGVCVAADGVRPDVTLDEGVQDGVELREGVRDRVLLRVGEPDSVRESEGVREGELEGEAVSVCEPPRGSAAAKKRSASARIAGRAAPSPRPGRRGRRRAQHAAWKRARKGSEAQRTA